MVSFSYHSGIYSLHAEQHLPISRDLAWEFFSNPGNLQHITPDHLDFNITSPHLEPMYVGQIVTYRIGLFPLIRSNWVTEITSVVPKTSFVDEQRFGPYKMWHHIHSFESTEEGVLMKDTVYFKLPMGALGRLFFPVLVRPKLSDIFTYRKEKLDEVFSDHEFQSKLKVVRG